MRINLAVLTVCGLLFSTNILYSAQYIDPATAVDCGAWITESIQGNMAPPFSFQYGDIPASVLLKRWKYSRTTLPAGESESVRSYLWTDRATGFQLECRVKTFSDFNAAEWVIYMRNTGTGDSPRISALKTADFTVTSRSGGDGWQVFRYAGARDGGHDYRPCDKALAVGDTLQMYPHGGRSSSWCLPYFNVKVPGGGLMVAVGWTGDWKAGVRRSSDRAMLVQAGLSEFDAVLRPGEEVRLPSTVVMPWRGEDRMDGQNAFRRLVLAHYFPKVHGERVQVPLMNNFANNDDPWPCDEYSCSTDYYDIAVVKRQQYFGVLTDGYWLDAGWYSRAGDAGKGYWWHSAVGNWTPDPVRYPDGIAPVSDAVHATGGKMMLWYEPERANVDSDWAHEHPEFMLTADGSPAVPLETVTDSSFIVNLGNPAARRWVTDYMVRHLADSKVDIYRQDFNIEPSEYWHAADAQDRKGMTEVLYINGLYAFLDSLRARLPYLVIDNCAGGGRRLDIEMYRRSIPMWRDDHESEHAASQCITYNLSQWLPVHCTATSYGSRYHYLSKLAAGGVLCWGDTGRASIPQQKHIIGAFREYSPYFLEDFYPLTGYRDLLADTEWLAYQLDRPSDGSGIVLAFKREGCTVDSITVALRGLDPGAQYMLQEVEYENHRRGDIYISTPWGYLQTEQNSTHADPAPRQCSGEELSKALEISIAAKKGVVMYKYTRKD